MSVYFPIANITHKKLTNFIIWRPIQGAVVRHVISKGILLGPFNYAEQNGYLNILIERAWVKMDVGGGLVSLQSFESL